MTSHISFFYSRSTWHALGVSILPIVADQLVQRVFSKKCSSYNLGTASLITGTVTYLLLSRELPPSFKLGAPILYLAYKATQYYLSRPTPPDERSKPSPRPSLTQFPTMPYHMALAASTTTAAAVSKESEQQKEHPEADQGPARTDTPHEPLTVAPETLSSASSSPLPASSPAAPTADELAERKRAADRLNASVEAERLAVLRFQKIIEPFERSEIMSLKIQVKPLPNAAPVAGKKSAKAKEEKVQIRFGSTHVFKLGKTQVEALNKEGCAVTENTLFFWINISGTERSPFSFIPLTMLDDLHPNTKEFSLCLKEKDHQLILPFKEKQIVRLKVFAQTIRACQKVEIIHSGIAQPFAKSDTSTHDQIGALLINDMARVNHARCYLVPFMKKT